MPDVTYQPKVYRKQGGLEFVIASGGQQTVESGGLIVLQSGGKLQVLTGGSMVPNSGTQSPTVTAFVTGGGTTTATLVTRLNRIRTALIGIGAIAVT